MLEHGTHHGHSHGHLHAAVDPADGAGVGIRAVKLSLLIMALTGLLQLAVTAVSGSAALLADSIHNVGDAFTAVPLWIAFRLSRRKPSPRFAYGYGRAEDLAGAVVVAVIVASAAAAGYESVLRLLHPQEVTSLGAVAAAALLGFAGNEAAARLRIRAGRKIGSVALIADGQHARADALTSLAVLFGAAGVRLGYPSADPLIGLLIAGMILKIAWESGRPVLGRLLDEMDPETTMAMTDEASRVAGVLKVTDLRARWTGHRLNADVSLAVAARTPVEAAQQIAGEVSRRLKERWPQLAGVTTQVGPIAVLAALLSGCAATRLDTHATGSPLPLREHVSSGKVLVLWGTAWRGDQKERARREQIAAEAIGEFFASGLGADIVVKKTLGGEPAAALSDAQILRSDEAAAGGFDKIVLLRLEELGPTVTVYLSPILWQGATDILFRVRVLDVRRSSLSSDASVHWVRGGPFVLRGTSVLKESLTSALAAVFQ